MVAIRQSVLLLGATGATGSRVLTELLSSSHFTKVGEYGRRTTAADRIAAGKDKLEQKTIDYENLGDLSGGKWDVVMITLGTTRKAAGSAEAFEKIDREYVINAARAAKSKDPNHKQRLIYLSSSGANANSSFLYLKSKGLTELGLAGLGYDETIVFRPAYLKGERETRKIALIPGMILESAIGAASYLSNSLQIEMSELAKSMTLAAQLGTARLPPAAGACKEGGTNPFTILGNAGAMALAKMTQKA
ncbi:hypothetical protein HWV62_21854 [Athelia sp. TMB]|nr:hypothetical protein HWV62_21854 [Athelia sp. TMB]